VLATVPAAGAVGAPHTGTVPVAPVPSTVVSIPAALATAPVRVMLVGDSVAITLGRGLLYHETGSHITLANQGIVGCGVVQGTKAWAPENGQQQAYDVGWPCWLGPKHGFVPWPEAWRHWLREIRPNLVVLLAGRWEVVDRVYQGRRTNILHPVFAAYVKRMLERAVTIGTSGGAHMVLMTSPCFSEGEQPDGTPFPEDNVRRVQEYNRLVREVGAEFPATVTVQDLYAMTCPGGKFTPTLAGVQLRSPDGVHFAPGAGIGADLLAPRILPLWEQLGHEQEAAGGTVVTGSIPTHLFPA